jgi:RHS repeat-associated protein
MKASHGKRLMETVRASVQWLALSFLLVSVHALAQSAGTVTYVYTDPQGTPLAEADVNGNITATFEYTPYGTYAPQGTSTPGPTPNGPGYTGHVNDPETNLIYMQARYYDPVTGHFLSKDPVIAVAGQVLNFGRYGYAENNPINDSDPTGAYAKGLTSGQINCEIYVHVDCFTSASDDGGGGGPKQLSSTDSFWQYLIGAAKGASNELCALPIIQCDDDTPPLSPSNATQAAGLVGGVFVVRAGVVIATEGKDEDAPIWSETKTRTVVTNAFEHWEKHRLEFPELQNANQYARAAKRFVNSPPPGTLIKMRSGGDILLYDPSSNTFAVRAANGSPRTYFRPVEKMEYWNKQ